MNISLHDFQDVSGLLGSGVYALMRQGQVQYIGKSKRLLRRLYTHLDFASRKKRGLPVYKAKSYVKTVPFNGIRIFPCPEDKMGALEARLIREYAPKYNVKHLPSFVLDGPLTIDVMGMQLTLNANKRQETWRRL